MAETHLFSVVLGAVPIASVDDAADRWKSAVFVEISNTPRDYAWGSAGRISVLLGDEPTEQLEAELWLGAHPGSPARIDSDADFIIAGLRDRQRAYPDIPGGVIFDSLHLLHQQQLPR